MSQSSNLPNFCILKKRNLKKESDSLYFSYFQEAFNADEHKNAETQGGTTLQEVYYFVKLAKSACDKGVCLCVGYVAL